MDPEGLKMDPESIHDAVEKIIQDFHKEKWRAKDRSEKVPKEWTYNLFDDPINWGDLSCSMALVDGNGDAYVEIEEACPTAPNIQNEVEKRLSEMGIEATVKTQW